MTRIKPLKSMWIGSYFILFNKNWRKMYSYFLFYVMFVRYTICTLYSAHNHHIYISKDICMFVVTFVLFRIAPNPPFIPISRLSSPRPFNQSELSFSCRDILLTGAPVIDLI